VEDFIKSHGGIACGNARRMKEATDWLLLLGTVEKARRKMDQLLKKHGTPDFRSLPPERFSAASFSAHSFA
jgi:hypothetical protein